MVFRGGISSVCQQLLCIHQYASRVWVSRQPEKQSLLLPQRAYYHPEMRKFSLPDLPSAWDNVGGTLLIQELHQGLQLFQHQGHAAEQYHWGCQDFFSNSVENFSFIKGIQEILAGCLTFTRQSTQQVTHCLSHFFLPNVLMFKFSLKQQLEFLIVPKIIVSEL